MRKRLTLIRERINEQGLPRVFEHINATANVMEKTIVICDGRVPTGYEAMTKRVRRVADALRYVLTQRRFKERKMRVI